MNSEDLKDITSALAGLADKNTETRDSFGNLYCWYELREPELIYKAGEILAAHGARLAMITAWKPEHGDGLHSLCYEFVLKGIVHSCTLKLTPEHPAVPSITPLFANADWHEREMMELSGIKVENHPDPKRLFLDEKLDQGVLNQIVPLSVLMNGASSTDLWERIMAAKEIKA